MGTKRNYREFFALLKQLPHAEKEVAVLEYTSGRTSSLSEMTDEEYRRMIISLRSMCGQEGIRKARSKALRQLQLYGVNTASWEAVDAFVCQPRIAGKKFSRLSVRELDALTSKMRAIRDKRLKEAERSASRALDDSLKREAWGKQDNPS